MFGFWPRIFPILILVGSLGFIEIIRADGETISVVTTYGEIVGQKLKVTIVNENSKEDVYVQAFQGIPFAQPPVGKLRFKAPIEPKPWVQKRMALKQSSGCMQYLPGNFSVSIPPGNYSEDCLYLNVWVPEPVPKNAAVMVWIYGGAFAIGSTDLYDFGRFAATQNIILVSMNYRISTLGFIYFGNEECPGNMGLLDQDLALKWVRKNIDRFGGDPEKVTVFGQSAGSASTAFHLLNPNSQHLFKRAILQSGPPSADWALYTKSEAMDKSIEVAKVVGCGQEISNVQATIDCLRKLDARFLVETSAKLSAQLTLNHRPVMDGKFISENFDDAVKGVKNKEVLLGVTDADGIFVVSDLLMSEKVPPTDLFDAYIKKNIGDISDDVKKSIRFYYNDHCGDIKSNFVEETITTRLSTDRSFTCGTSEIADNLAKAGIKTYLYQWNHKQIDSKLPVWAGAEHGAEIPFLIGIQPIDIKSPETKLSNMLMSYWGSFAKHGDPNIETIPSERVNRDPWPVYTTEKKGRLDIGLSESKQQFGALQDDQCHFWKHDFPLISGKSRQ